MHRLVRTIASATLQKRSVVSLSAGNARFGSNRRVNRRRFKSASTAISFGLIAAITSKTKRQIVVREAARETFAKTAIPAGMALVSLAKRIVRAVRKIAVVKAMRSAATACAKRRILVAMVRVRATREKIARAVRGIVDVRAGCCVRRGSVQSKIHVGMVVARRISGRIV